MYMKKENKEEGLLLIDLMKRKDVRIVQTTKKNVSDREMREFEEKLNERYKILSEFTKLCIQKNFEVNKLNVSEKKYNETMKSVMENNKLLEEIISINRQEQDN